MFKRIILGLIVLLAIAVGIAFLLPGKVHVERSIAIAAPAEKIFPLINSPRRFNEWSPWAQIDPDMKITFSGPESGVGATMEWQSENRNVGAGNGN